MSKTEPSTSPKSEHKDIKSARLDETLSNVTPEELARARRHVAEKVAEAEAGSLPPPTGEKRTTSSSTQKAITSAAEEAATAVVNQRIDKLDLISDVQLVLVDKLLGATKLLWVSVILFGISAIGLVFGVLLGLEVLDRQKEIVVEQRAARVAAQEAKKEATATKEQIEATALKVDEAVRSTPKLEIDAEGTAKVIVPVKKDDLDEDPPPAPKVAAAKKKRAPSTPVSAPAPPAPAPKKKSNIDIAASEVRVEFR